jgi:hypothetical protein
MYLLYMVTIYFINGHKKKNKVDRINCEFKDSVSL